MRKTILHLIVALLTFIIGGMVGSLIQKPITNSASINIIPESIRLTKPLETEKVCEVHGLILKAERIRSICGEFHGRFKGGWAQLDLECNDSQKRRMLPEDAQFILNEVGGLNTLRWWREYEAAKKNQFPHGYGNGYMECEPNGAQCHTIDVCAECRAAEVRWKRDAYRQQSK